MISKQKSKSKTTSINMTITPKKCGSYSYYGPYLTLPKKPIKPKMPIASQYTETKSNYLYIGGKKLSVSSDPTNSNKFVVSFSKAEKNSNKTFKKAIDQYNKDMIKYKLDVKNWKLKCQEKREQHKIKVEEWKMKRAANKVQIAENSIVSWYNRLQKAKSKLEKIQGV